MARRFHAGAAVLLSAVIGAACQAPPPTGAPDRASQPAEPPGGSVAPDADLGSSTPDPTLQFSPGGDAAPDADTAMPTPEPTLQFSPGGDAAPDADTAMPTPEGTVRPSDS